MLMTPGVALFYGGMVRRKNILSTLMMSFMCLGLVGLLWILYGYSLSFGPDHAGIIGGLNYIGLNGVGEEPSAFYATTVPHLAFMVFQAMFAVISVALITGAVVERIKFSSLLVFAGLWLTVVYCPIAHWVWGNGGWLNKLGALLRRGGCRSHQCRHVGPGTGAASGTASRLPRRGHGAQQRPDGSARRGPSLVRLVWL